MIRVAILGEFLSSNPVLAATDAAIRHSRDFLGIDVETEWISTADVAPGALDYFQGLWIAPGSPYKSLSRTLTAIQFARENGIPCFGTCGGFQHMVLEYARNVLGFQDAQHAEYDPDASNLFLSKLDCSLAGREMALRLSPGSQVAGLYGATEAIESYYCDFGVAPDRIEMFKHSSLRIVGADLEGEFRILELPGHPFFVGTLFVPQARSTPSHPHPLITGLLQAVTNVGERAKEGCGRNENTPAASD